jgi:hypothetical protein
MRRPSHRSLITLWNQGVGGARLLCVHRVILAHPRHRTRHPAPATMARVYFAFTESFLPTPAIAPATPPLPRWRASSGAGKGLGATRGTCASGWALRPPMTRAIPARSPQQASGDCPAHHRHPAACRCRREPPPPAGPVSRQGAASDGHCGPGGGHRRSWATDSASGCGLPHPITPTEQVAGKGLPGSETCRTPAPSSLKAGCRQPGNRRIIVRWPKPVSSERISFLRRFMGR